MMRFIFPMRVYFHLLGCFLLLASSSAQALVTCSLNNARTDTLQLSPGNISAGPDLPLGSIIYRGTWQDQSYGSQLACRTNVSTGESGTANFVLGIAFTPYPLSSWSGSPYPGRVYTTNIPGIGIAIWYAGNAVTTSISYTTGVPTLNVTSSTTTLYYGQGGLFDISLIKIGSTPPGNYTINTASFPTAIRYYTAANNVAGFPITTRTINFAGNLTVSAQTCTTPDVNVSLGSYDTSTLPAIGSTTPWVNYAIQLTNCPLFQGYYSGSNPVNLSNGIIPTSTNNQIGVRLTPASSIIDAANGIMAVTPATNAATVVGIQIANADTTPPAPFNFSAERVLNLPKTGTTTININMATRYIKTNATVTAGRADGKMAFTINYY